MKGEVKFLFFLGGIMCKVTGANMGRWVGAAPEQRGMGIGYRT